jgi:hypothetical protein
MTTIRRALAFTVALIVSPLMLSGRVLAQVGAVIDDPEAYAVYAAVVRVGFGPRDKPLTKITLLKETRAYIPCPLDEAIQPLWRPVVESYQKENDRARVIQPGFDLGVSYAVITSAELGELVRHRILLSKFSASQSSGSQVFAGLPGGRLVVVSAVGFTRRKPARWCPCDTTASSLEPGKSDADCYQGYQLMLEKREGGGCRPTASDSAPGLTDQTAIPATVYPKSRVHEEHRKYVAVLRALIIAVAVKSRYATRHSAPFHRPAATSGMNPVFGFGGAMSTRRSGMSPVSAGYCRRCGLTVARSSFRV